MEQHLCGCCGGAAASIVLILHSCVDLASTQSLRSVLSQSCKWLLICGRVKAKTWLLEKQHLYHFPAKIKTANSVVYHCHPFKNVEEI